MIEARVNAIGIDIGRSGALALLSPAGDLLDVEDMPVLTDGPKHRPTVNGPLFAAILRRWKPKQAFVEHVAARPNEGPVGAFSFGRSRGVIEGALSAYAVPHQFLTPGSWKVAVGIPIGRLNKGLARSKAISRWPRMAEMFARVGDHDRAEAALIGLAGLIKTGAVSPVLGKRVASPLRSELSAPVDARLL